MIMIQHLGRDVKNYLQNLFSGGITLPERCPCCHGTGTMIRWGYYQRKYPEIPIARVLCKACNKSSSLLPSFLLPYQRTTTEELQNLAISYCSEDISLEEWWAARPEIPQSLKTLARWIKGLVRRAEEVLPIITRKILELSPSCPLLEKGSLIAGEKTLSKEKRKLRDFFSSCEILYRESKSLIEDLIFEPSRLLEFTSLFLWKEKGIHLLPA